jgi:hypothetical protein
MFVCCECCVFSGRGLCDGLITRPEESYRLCRVVVCNHETSKKRGGQSPLPGCENTTTVGCNANKKKKKKTNIYFINALFSLMSVCLYDCDSVFKNSCY